MATKRKGTARIRSTDQLRALASPISIEIIQALRTGGPSSVADLGPRLGRKAVSLHYHVRKLKQVGLLREVGTRRSGARTQAIYDVLANALLYENLSAHPERKKHVDDIVAAMLRLAARNFAQAADSPDLIRETGPHRNIVADRCKARLTRAELAKVNKHLRAAHAVFCAGNHRSDGELCTLTMVMTPEADSSE